MKPEIEVYRLTPAERVVRRCAYDCGRAADLLVLAPAYALSVYRCLTCFNEKKEGGGEQITVVDGWTQ